MLSGRTTAHLNLRWTVADTDTIRKMALGGLTAEEIAWRFRMDRARHHFPTSDEVASICADAGVHVRRREPA